jgi:hypothetical protein
MSDSKDNKVLKASFRLRANLEASTLASTAGRQVSKLQLLALQQT